MLSIAVPTNREEAISHPCQAEEENTELQLPPSAEWVF